MKPKDPQQHDADEDYGGAQYRQENEDFDAYRDEPAPRPPRPGVGHGNDPDGASASAATGGSTSGGATTPAEDSTGPRHPR